MTANQAVIDAICGSFAGNDYPGDTFLQGSFDGCEPYEETAPFRGRTQWADVEPEFLDTHAGALSFFSEAGFRFFLPAYLVADLRDRLRVADPLFHLTHGFVDTAVTVPIHGRTFTVKSGGSAFVNPRRFGAATFHDYARYRLAVFTREEAAAIVAYLQCKRALDGDGLGHARIDAALDAYWLERARSAPTAASLRQHLAEQSDYLAAVRGGSPAGGNEP
ncbi:MAG: hypothetical protein RKL24_01315 [Defluviicoccus sp.]|nr:hypothetical protein [Defluviicoccus sp.]